jgi:hypothetical protein
MPRLEAFDIPGLALLFYSDDHEPPHFHVKRRGEWELRVFFLECTATYLEAEVVFSKRRKMITTAQREELCRLIDLHRAALLTEWERKVQTQE